MHRESLVRLLHPMSVVQNPPASPFHSVASSSLLTAASRSEMANIDPITISFDWNDLDELEVSLRNLAVVGFFEAARTAKHCDVLRHAQACLTANDIAVANAVELAEGHADLAVLLLEPADTESKKPHHEDLPRTIQYIDEELLESCRTRDWRNTCIIDVRPFRSNERRMLETAEMRERQDNLAYDVTGRMLDMLEPDVLILCQSATSSSLNEFAQSLSSSIGEFGKLSLYRLESGKQVITICGFHPMHAMRYAAGEGAVVRRIRKAALRFSFLQAVNILSGRIIRGPGIRKLQDAVYGASRSPHMLLASGLLDRSLDDRFKGIFLAHNATTEFKQMWQEMMAKKLEQVRRIKKHANVSQDTDVLVGEQESR